MVVCDFNFVGIAVLPAKADSVLLVDANRPLAGPFAQETFQAIPRRHSQLGKVLHAINLIELTAGAWPEPFWTNPAGCSRIRAVKDIFSPAIGKSAYHD